MSRVATDLSKAVALIAPGGAGAVAPRDCDLVWVEGPEAERFLQGTLTNDVAALAPGRSAEALLLDVKGHIRHAMHVHRDGPEAFTLVAAAESGPALAADLEDLHVAEDLEIFADSAQMAVTNAAGAVESDIEILLRPGLRGLVGADPAAVGEALGVPVVQGAAVEAVRVAAGVIDPGGAGGRGPLVQEAGLEDVAVSFSKGCYLGQETVARVAHRGHVNRTPRGLRLSGPVATGAAVELEGREVGRVAASVVHPSLGPIAVAILRGEVPDGAEVAVAGAAGAPARVTGLPLS